MYVAVGSCLYSVWSARAVWFAGAVVGWAFAEAGGFAVSAASRCVRRSFGLVTDGGCEFVVEGGWIGGAEV